MRACIRGQLHPSYSYRLHALVSLSSCFHFAGLCVTFLEPCALCQMYQQAGEGICASCIVPGAPMVLRTQHRERYQIEVRFASSRFDMSLKEWRPRGRDKELQ
ncbi:unnamed protein product [Protopolystoma xenopodis]|uniref:Uncharacterized protein n=1 Tax=Protopolystoma xenopodis TaxID=117903 RepID=A0A448X326_9PLAT|nr:unnamed protein product [Protopolystoma xenopodis]